MDPFLYAITNDKVLKKTFFSQRDASQFFCEKKETSYSEWTTTELNKDRYILKDRGYSSYDVYGRDHPVYIVSTEYEEFNSYIKADRLYEKLSAHVDDLMLCVNNKYKEPLKNIGYYNILDRVRTGDIVCVPDIHMVLKEDNLSHYYPDIFKIFCYLYGDTFK